MATIISIETSTRNCSVAIGVNGRVVSIRNDFSDTYSHAEKIHVFIRETMDKAGLKFENLDAVAVSSGPGSYTGLRIGVSAAKGLAYARNIPLIAIDTLESLALEHVDGNGNHLFIPVIDARRLEVFCAGFDGLGNRIFATRAEILEADSFPEADVFEKVFYFGDNAEKCAQIFRERTHFQLISDAMYHAGAMVVLAEKAYHKKSFADLAYYEPFYLKDFVAGKPKQTTR